MKKINDYLNETIDVYPLQVCDKTAKNLSSLNRSDIIITESTWFYDGGGCC